MTGGGKVSCSRPNDASSLSDQEQFLIVPVSENMNVYTIQSVATPGIYLRMDGHGLTQFSNSGEGIVNCQKGVTDQEKFKFVYNGDGDGSFSIESSTSPFVFLRMDESAVNCQYGADCNEKFKLRSVASYDGLFQRLEKLKLKSVAS